FADGPRPGQGRPDRPGLPGQPGLLPVRTARPAFGQSLLPEQPALLPAGALSRRPRRRHTMVAMKDLRALLIDCRIELRKLSRDFQKTELCERLGLAIQHLSSAEAAPARAATDHGPTPEKAQTVSQVALAWQTAARDLKCSDPAIHARLSEKVMRLLETRALVDPATEILQLEA